MANQVAHEQADLDKLQREVEASIASSNRELQELFDKLRTKVHGAFSRMDVGPRAPRTMQLAHWGDERELDDQRGVKEYAYPSSKQGMFGFNCCNVACNDELSEANPVVRQATHASVGPQFVEDLDDLQRSPRRKDSSPLGRSGSILFPLDKPSPKSDPTRGYSITPVGEQKQENGNSPSNSPKSPSKRSDSNLSLNLKLRGSKKGEFRNRQLALAKGEFEGRSNLWAFLQTKEWDSLQAQEPDATLDEKYDAKTGPPTIRNRLQTFTHSTAFDVFIGSIILLNSLVMGLQLEYQGIRSADTIGITSDDTESAWPKAKEAFGALDHVFAIIYLAELILRFGVDRCAYFREPLNWMDFTIVVVSCVELYIIPLTGQESPDMSLIRLMRVLRIVRVLRMVRILKLLPRLRVLVGAVASSIGSLLWSIVLMSLYILIAAVFMAQSLQAYLRDESEDPTQREQVYVCYGSFTRSLITMFEITLAPGTWGRCGRIVIFSTSRLYAIFFLGYLGLVSFALIRVITALFLKDTLASSAKDAEVAMADQFRDPHYVKQIRKVFKLMDTDGDGSIQFTELHEFMGDERVCMEMEKLGVIPHEVQGLFTLMDDGDDEISFCEFLTGIMRLKNSSKGVDLATVLYENKKLLKRVLAVGNQVDALKKVLHSRP